MKEVFAETQLKSDQKLIVSAIIFSSMGVIALYKHMPYLAIACGVFVGFELIRRRYKGPNLGKPVFTLTADAFSFRQFDHIPTKITRIAAKDIQRLIIYGPEGDRSFMFFFNDKKSIQVRPRYGKKVEMEIFELLKSEFSDRFNIEEIEPPTAFSAIRGDYHPEG